MASPDPVFRKLANVVDLHYAYRGSPGIVTVSGQLSTPSGWHSIVPLAAPKTITTNRYDATVRLDLLALDARAQTAAAVIGIPTGQVTIDVIPRVKITGGARFAPTLSLSLSALQLSLTGGAPALVVKDATEVQQVSTASRTIGVLGRTVTLATARTLSTILLLAALLGALALALIAQRSAPTSGGAGIRRRYAPLLVSVQPMPAPPGRPMVDVETSRPWPDWPRATGCWCCTGRAVKWRPSSSRTKARHAGQDSYHLRVPVPPSVSCSALLISGTVGAGKTSVAEMVGDLLTEAGVPNAVIDLDWLRRSWPSPAGDRFNVAMALRNLRSVARNYRDAGAVRIVLAGVIETQVERDRHQEALGVPLAMCRLLVDLPLVRARLARRHEGEGAVLQWHLARSGELDTILEAGAIEDFTVSATDLSISSTAKTVLSTAGW